MNQSDRYAPRGQVLSLCDRTGVVVEPWVAAGYDATIVDLQHDEFRKWQPTPDGGYISAIGTDVLEWEAWNAPFDIVFAFPPCTDLANSGARWMRDKGLGALVKALQVVEACRNIAEQAGCPWMLENPMGQLSTYWRKPDYTFDPYEFAGYCDDPDEDAYTKRTCLWVGNGFQLPLRRPREAVHGSKMHLLAPSEDRANLRSVTPRGFARAVFEANAPVLATAAHNHHLGTP